jgi:hypothetical protein
MRRVPGANQYSVPGTAAPAMPPYILSLKNRLATADVVVRHGYWRIALLALPHAAALALMTLSETAFLPKLCFLLTWGVLNFVWLALLRRPALAAALSLVMITVLTLLSQLKYNVLMMTANFVDLMIVDTDTATFLFTIFPALRWIVAGAAAVTVPVMVLMWRYDPFRVRRVAAVGALLACLGGLTAGLRSGDQAAAHHPGA